MSPLPRVAWTLCAVAALTVVVSTLIVGEPATALQALQALVVCILGARVEHTADRLSMFAGPKPTRR